MKWIYKSNRNNTARFVLGEYNNTNEKTLICLGINPSTATPNNLDRTLQKVKLIARKHNYINWIMINVYPQRATKPNGIHINCDKYLHKTNIVEIENILKTFPNADILFAYGNLISKRPYLRVCLEHILNIIKKVDFKGELLCIKLTVKGNPVHPLYQKCDADFMQYKNLLGNANI